MSPYARGKEHETQKLTIYEKLFYNHCITRGRSSAGRALEWHSRGHGFDPHRLHQKNVVAKKPLRFFIVEIDSVKCKTLDNIYNGMYRESLAKALQSQTVNDRARAFC